MGLVGRVCGKIFTFTWLVFLLLLIQGIREKHKVKIIVSAIVVVIPFIMWGILISYIWKTGI